jgi:hypothetical protein
MMALVPGMSYQGSMAAMNQMQQPGVLNRALAVGINLRPGGNLLQPQQQFDQIFNRIFMGGPPTADVLEKSLQPGSPAAVDLETFGITPGSDNWNAFVEYAMKRVKAKSGKNPMGNIPNLSTMKGVKGIGLDTPYMSQLQYTSTKSQLLSTTEPGIADAATNLNTAANALLQAAQRLGGGGLLGGASSAMGSMTGMLTHPLGLLGGLMPGGSLLSRLPGLGGLGGGGGGIGGMMMGMLPGGGLLSHLLHFQEGGDVPGTGPQLALVHGGETVLNQQQAAKRKGGIGGLTTAQGGGFDPHSPLHLLTLQLTDPNLENTAIKTLLSPTPSGSVLAASIGKGGMGAQSAKGAPAQHQAGLLGGARTPQQFAAALAAAMGTPGLAGAGGPAQTTQGQAGAAPAQPYSWKQRGPSGTPVDVSYMFAGGGSQTSNGSGSGSGGSGGTGAGTPTNLTGSGNVQQAYNYYLGKGLKDFQAAGIIGNFAQESGVSPTSSQAGGPGMGIAQWSKGGRWDQLTAWAKAQNRDPNSLATQLDYTWVELTGAYGSVLSALKASSDVTSATTVFEQGYEAAGIPDMSNRLKYAQNVLSSKGAGYARGTQNIARNQLALLHRGEAVVPAADNYSTNPYNKGGAAGSSMAVHLNFKQGSVVLQVPSNASQKDMENVASQFVAAISKPQVLAAVRSK